MRYLFSILLMALLPVMAAEEIIVSLSTETKLLPLYFCPWVQASGDQTLSSAHLRELAAALRFDLDAGGTIKVAEVTAERGAQVNAEGLSQFESEEWRRLGVLYVLRTFIQGHRLHVRVDSVSAGGNAASYAADLCGNLTTDRQQIHRLADALHADLFGKAGVASTSLLYTIRHQQPGTEEWRSEVWQCDYDGANAHQITRDGHYCVTPTFLPPETGKTSGTFCYVSYRQGQPKIYTASLKSAAPSRLVQLRGNQLMPTFAPQRNQVAFVSDAGGNPDLFLQSFDPLTGPQGKPRQIFAARGAAQATPSFSPDGNQIAFVSNKDGTPRIYLLTVPAENVSPRSLKPRLITRRNRENTCPAWSPDGRYIAYSAMTEGTRQIWLYDLQTQEERQLTTGVGHKENPSWAPDSCHLVFNSETREGCELFLVNLNQPKAIKITSGPGEKRFPAWEPRAA